MNAKYVTASIVATSMLAFAPFASATELGTETNADVGVRLGQFLRADVKGEADVRARAEMKARAEDNNGMRAMTAVVTAKTGTTLTVKVKEGSTYMVEAANAEIKGGTLADIAVGDSIVIKGDVSGSAVVAKSIVELGTEREKDAKRKEKEEVRESIAAKLGRITVGTITSINGALLTINPFGAKATSTVTTDANTVFKARGDATTTAALSVGQQVLVIGTTTATSTTGDSITASVVKVLGKGLGHLRFWLWFQ